jgi:hypothetical protein
MMVVPEPLTPHANCDASTVPPVLNVGDCGRAAHMLNTTRGTPRTHQREPHFSLAVLPEDQGGNREAGRLRKGGAGSIRMSGGRGLAEIQPSQLTWFVAETRASIRDCGAPYLMTSPPASCMLCLTR